MLTRVLAEYAAPAVTPTPHKDVTLDQVKKNLKGFPGISNSPFSLGSLPLSFAS